MSHSAKNLFAIFKNNKLYLFLIYDINRNKYLFGEIKMETTILIKLLNDMNCSIYIIRYNNNLPSLNYLV